MLSPLACGAGNPDAISGLCEIVDIAFDSKRGGV